MKQNIEPNVKPEQKLLRIVLISSIIVILLGGLFFLISNLLPSKKSLAGTTPNVYDCNGNISSKEVAKVFDACVDGDTLKVTKELVVESSNKALYKKNIIFLIDGCEMRWEGDYLLYIGKDCKILLKDGGKLTTLKNKTFSKAIVYFNREPLVSFDGKNGKFSFDDVNKYGGISMSGLVALPVKLISFNAKFENETVNLEWATATEINNSHFEVQRSVNKVDWTVLDSVKGNGNSNTIKKYSYSDKIGKLTGEIYYRLKQVDFDGKSEFSNIRVVSLNNTKINIGKVYPNPANDIIKVNINTEGEYDIVLQDINGKEILRSNGNSSVETINVSEIPAGIYFVKIQSNVVNESHRIVIKH
ncbi:MAG: T9SS type A sorting domain-containing protein [Bacteroidetes bacterium]|nr:T9SS type A sorting domain-containing protein [Bacteroidota bacterium]